MTKKYYDKRIKEIKENNLFDGCCPFSNVVVECNQIKYESCKDCPSNDEKDIKK